MPARIQTGDAVDLGAYPGGDRPAEYRHERHDYFGTASGFPGYEFVVEEPLARQIHEDGWDGAWATRIRETAADPGSGYCTAFLRKACDQTCPARVQPGKRKSVRAKTCDCPRQLHVSLKSRSSETAARSEWVQRAHFWGSFKFPLTSPSPPAALLSSSPSANTFYRSRARMFHAILFVCESSTVPGESGCPFADSLSSAPAIRF